MTSRQRQFDAVSSVEMGEHVGEEQYPTYVDVMHRVLKPGGRLLLQQMSRHENTAPGGGPFIESYIAPDMHMRPLWQTVKIRAGRRLRGARRRGDAGALRPHRRALARDARGRTTTEFVALQGEEVARVWRLYLVGGALAFEQGRMGVDQILAVKS